MPTSVSEPTKIKAGQSKAPPSKPGSKPEAKDDLKSLPMAEVEKKLGSSPQKRLAQYGPNELTEKKTNLFLKFLSYFWGPIPWMIEVAVILSGVVGHWPDFFIILLLLVTNAVVGFWEEKEASNAAGYHSAGLEDAAQIGFRRPGVGEKVSAF
jgi:H+-transporting ATPase